MNQILFVKIGAIGDIVMAMAAAQRVLRDLPESTITWVCGKEVSPLIKKYLPHVVQIVVDEKRMFGSNKISQLFEILKLNFRLAGSHWDLIATGYRDWRYRLLTLLARGHTRRSIDHSIVPMNFGPGEYHGDCYYSLLSGRPTIKGLEIHPGDLKIRVNSSDREFKQSRRIAIAPGGAKNFMRDDGLRRYPIGNYRVLCEKLIQLGHEVCIVGGTVDDWVREPLQMPGLKFELGSWRLEEVADQLSGFDTLVTHDSGLMHLGILAGIQVIALFGPTRGDEKVPRHFDRNGSRALQGGRALSCAPCYDGKNYAICSSNECLKHLDPIVDVLAELI